jgi:hypothetical protein
MDNLRGWALYLVVALFTLFLGAAVLVVYSIQPRSGGSWGFMQAMWSDDDAGSDSAGVVAPATPKRTDWRTRQIEQLQGRLDQQTAEYDTLEKEYTRIVTDGQGRAGQSAAKPGSDEWMRELEAEMAAMEANRKRAAGPDHGDSEEVSAQLRSQLDAVQSKLEATEFLYEMQVQETDRLKGQMTEASDSQSDANDEDMVQLQRERDLQGVASDVLVRSGAASVPALIQALGDNRAYVREWAAEVLGALGADAREAVPALIDSVEDGDEFVRSAAQRALAAIENN